MIEEFKLDIKEKATLISLVCSSFEGHRTIEETQNSLKELSELLRTLGIECGEEIVQNKKNLDPATMLGTGKIEEIATIARKTKSKLLVFDFELTASQLRNIKNLAQIDVIDRNSIILEIFASHARTKDAKIQIEISRLQYMLPRLQSLWSHFSKQKGGIGLKGEGEQQLELDRRIIRQKIESYKKQLKEIEISRREQRKKRENQSVTAALVGYTNAGKSSIMNRLCKVDILEEDKLFATLDSTYRMLNPDTKPPMILIDTVGFLSNLPNTLIEGFKTTLQSALEADLLIIVCDLSDPNWKKQLEVTQKVLLELNITDKEQIIVFNKKDLISDPFMPKIAMRGIKESFLISSFDKEDIKNLREYVVNYFLNLQGHYDLFIPYEAGEALSKVQSKTNIIKTSNHEQGIFYRIRVPDFIFNQTGLAKFILAPHDPKIDELGLSI